MTYAIKSKTRKKYPQWTFGGPCYFWVYSERFIRNKVYSERLFVTKVNSMEEFRSLSTFSVQTRVEAWSPKGEQLRSPALKEYVDFETI